MGRIIDKYGNVTIYSVEGKTLPIYQTIIKQGEFGKLQAFIEDDMLEEIMYNGAKRTLKVCHRKHGMCDTNLFIDESEIAEIVQRIARKFGRVIDVESPMLNLELPEYGRMNVTFPPISPEGITVTIRKFPAEQFTIIDLIRNGTISLDAAAFLWIIVDGLGRSPCNLLISGGVDSGKTTMLNALTFFIPERERVITIEDVSELRLLHENWVRLEASLSHLSLTELLKNALRMRPDRIIIGEVRGEEAEILFAAMNTGQKGCMSTIHANNARETITRLISKPMNVAPIMLGALHLILSQDKFVSGDKYDRKVIEICEIGEFEQDRPTLNTIFKFDGRSLVSTRTPSILRERISEEAGITLSEFDKILEERRDFLKSLIPQPFKALELFRILQNYRKRSI
ncbi:MAG: ATPase, T2SS/T4P/T4SS family [Candidatus Parvarchaeota archaeon]|nr:ATPase, T2SS/T4P/T4SS family [Candidatus Jingweiarchaeum tengchongense]MCW1298609.1 ATPase, T2SS/T4P/T4SS family [Candidatus Jingweiarchaeum tengchongense]MCW1300455.1 ATPase, T2SS/T4P/T4SS family [Candidatus Jingweiarchaeum tengchongense]MCW1304955.1 ATPase, T2SS/T4P/T4SS family [Candidatus Jingweiarchaeum tengchongense]MCW1305485.1 ATPase, T2SS/T4P/T4SS family [Candidatus Jingweiarchaeum tengchongense]